MPLAYKLWMAVLVSAAGVSAFHPTQEADVFFHLELGRGVLEHHARTVPEPHAFPEFEPSCIVPAWLWDVAAFGIQAKLGFEALSAFNLLAALVAAWLIALFTYARAGEAGFSAWAIVSAATVICASIRFELRPQTLAFALLAGFMLLLRAHGRRSGEARNITGAGLVALAMVWAQLHGSFVLAPALVAIELIPLHVSARSAGAELPPAQRRVDLLVLMGCLLALFTSAAGLDITSYIAGHGSGDAVRFIAEMRPPAWAELVSFSGPHGKAIALLWLVSLFGLTQASRWQWSAIGLAVLGHGMLSRANRFIAEDAILSAPLALSGAINVSAWAAHTLAPRLRRVLPPVLIAVSLALLVRGAWSTRIAGAQFGLGLERAAFPELAALYLRRLPAGSRVLTAFEAGPAIGFWSNGKLRTYVDGRTPMYFDDADYAVEREVFTNETGLDLAIRRFNVQAAVVERAHGVCDLLAKRWQPVVIEGRYSTFVPAERAAPLAGVEACGPEFVHPGRSPDDLAGLDRSIARLAALADTPFLDLLRAERALQTGGADPRRVAKLLARSASPVYVQAHRRARIAAAIDARDVDAAYSQMRDALREGDPSALRFIVAPGMGTLDLGRARELLELAIADRGEGTKPATRAMLAQICVQQSDVTCARYQALRAAARNAPSVEPSLAWLSEHAPTPRKRADARAWLELLRSEHAKTAANDAGL